MTPAAGSGHGSPVAAICYALVLGAVLGVPDHIFAIFAAAGQYTPLAYTPLAAVAAAGTACTAGAAVLQRQQP